VESFIARQPILDLNREVFGYELLFRSGPDNFFAGVDPDSATSRVVADSLGVHGLEALTDGSKAFINITRNVLLDERYAVLPPERTVLELLESIEPGRDVLDACVSATKAGYLLALDDFVFDLKFKDLLPLVDILKVDFNLTSPQQRTALAELKRKHGFDVLAEKVETPEQFTEAAELGCIYFQGYFFCKPQIISKQSVSPSKLSCLRLLKQLNQADLDAERLEEILRQDPGLAYRLLKYLNSAAFGLRNHVSSLRQAVMMLGPDTLRKWASLLVMSTLAGDKPHELLTTCLVRASFCEAIAPHIGLQARQRDAFLLGMFSLMDAMMDQPIEDVLSGMPVSPDILETLRGGTTELSRAYQLALALEHGRWSDVGRFAAEWKVDGDHLMQAYREAIRWTAEIPRRRVKAAPLRKAG
jgi:c-di-GMP-related signal transduction protein